MSHDVQLPQLQGEPVATGRDTATGGTTSDLRRLSAVPVDLSVEIGRTRMTVGQTLELREGSVITLERMADEPVDVLVNGTPIARGEVVVIDEQFGLRLTHVLGALPAAATAEAAAAGVEIVDGEAVPEAVAS